MGTKSKLIPIKTQPVTSSHIKEIGWDKNTLEVVFVTNKVYRYTPVTKDEYLEFIQSPSLGKWLHNNIKNNPKIKTRLIHGKV